MVLVKEISPLGNAPPAKVVKLPGELRIARSIQRVGDEGAVSRPNIAVMVAVEVENVGVVGGDDRAAAVDLCADNEQAPLKQLCRLWAEVFEIPSFLGEPGTPIHPGALEQAPGA